MGYRRTGSEELGWVIVGKNKYYTTTQSDVIPEDLGGYHIYKCTSVFREVTIEHLHEGKYSGYIFFNKKIHNKEHIENWLSWIRINKIDFKYISKPFPPFNPQKILIRHFSEIVR